MTTRVIRGRDGSVEVAAVGPALERESAAYRNVTADIIDRAVAETFSEANVQPEVASVMRHLMATDTSSAVAHAYYHGVANSGSTMYRPVHSRDRLGIPYVLTDAQVATLGAYAPEFSFEFLSREVHDHPMAAAARLVDRKVVESRVPPGVLVSDVGAALIPAVLSGKLGVSVHACTPVVDRKDPARHVLSNLRLRKIASDYTKSAEVRRSAAGSLERDPRFVCDKRVQDCSFQTKVLTSVHVYDVPMEDWAEIMDNKGAELVEGCILFPAAAFSRASGEIPAAGARFEVDATTNEFRMGFVGSPSWWYQHTLSDYLKYGVDQALVGRRGQYSYKVVERRGDTLFFRILKVGRAVPDLRQVYRVPGVEMVRVAGFPMYHEKHDMFSGARRTYLFPRVLWEDMLGHAKDMVERGSLSHERLFNYYRTVAPRQSINSVIVAGGTAVESLEDLTPLIVHVVLFAFMEVRKSQAETAAIVSTEAARRAAESEWTAYKLLAAFGQSLAAAVKLVCFPLVAVAKVVALGVKTFMQHNMYQWALEPVVQEVSAKLVLPGCFTSDSSVTADPDFMPEYADQAGMDALNAAKADPDVAATVLELLGGVLSESQAESLCIERPALEEETVVAETVSTGAKPGFALIEDASTCVGAQEVDSAEVERRRESVLEAIFECKAEAEKSEASCAAQFLELLVGGQPSTKKMRDRKEIFNNPEFWRVNFGVMESSLSGAPVEGFQHAAVYCPTPFDGSRLLPVSEQEFKGMSKGEYVERMHYVLPVNYSGWVYTNDSLQIHNGPAVVEALESALTKPMDFRVQLRQGPPGCGKTTQVVNAVGLQDVVLVPVRKAARETAERIAMKSPAFAVAAADQCRTVDSYLVNRNRLKKLKTLTTDVLRADEIFMTREGRWIAAAAHLGASLVEGYGDRKQIPHVPRAECPKMYVSMRSQSEIATYVSYRCPGVSVACWGGEYDWRVRSASKVRGSVKHVTSSLGMAIPKGCVMMGAYQADKKALQEKYAGCGVPIQIMTIHESEGNTYEHVWLHRFDLRVRNDKMSLYDKPEYALVAMSRNTHSFVYVAPRLGDLVSQWIERGADLRRVNAAMDLDSAGESKEFM